MKYNVKLISAPTVLLGIVLLAGGATLAHSQGRGRGPQLKVADAKPGQTRLIVSNGLRAPLEAVKADAEKAVGHSFIIEYGASLGLKATIESGQPFEVAIVTPEFLDEMTAKGKVVPGSRYDVALLCLGCADIGFGGVSPLPDGNRDISIRLQMSAKVFQELLRPRSFPCGSVVVNHCRMIPVSHIRPNAAFARLRQFPVQHLHRCIVGAHHLRRQYKVFQRLPESGTNCTKPIIFYKLAVVLK